MKADMVGRLADAAERAREYETVSEQVDLLRRQVDEAERRLTALRHAHDRERADLRRMEGRSVGRVVASLRGSREDDLRRERAEAELAARREIEARARLTELRRDHRIAQVRRAELAGAPEAYAALLDERERRLVAGGDRRAERLAVLAAERERLTARAGQVAAATRALAAARTALAEVGDHLAEADEWSTYDTFFSGGAVGSMMKHGRMDDAAAAARVADRRLAALRTELAELAGDWLASEPEPGDRFTDIFLDEIFTDIAARGRIRRAQEAVDRTTTWVTRLRDRLAGETDEIGRHVAALAAERVALLTVP